MPIATEIPNLVFAVNLKTISHGDAKSWDRYYEQFK